MRIEEVKIIRKQIDELNCRINSIRSIKGMNPQAQHGVGDDDKILHNVQKIMELESIIASKISQLIVAMDQVDKIISTIENKTIRTAMFYKYIDCLSDKEIALKMSYNVRQIYRFLKQGREEIKKGL